MTDKSEKQPSKPLPEKILGWVEDSGRALELRVARAFRQAGGAVRTSYAYVDTNTGTTREADVLAGFEWEEPLRSTKPLPCSLSAVVECKSSKDHPWVAFGDTSQQASPGSRDEWCAWANAPYTPVNDRFPALWIGQPPFQSASPATHIVTAKVGEREGSRSSESNPANDALRQVMSAVDALRKEHVDNWNDKPRGLFLLPVLVTSAPLFRCELDHEGEVHLTKVSSLEVWGYRPDASRTRVYVMSEEWVPEFARSLEACTAAAAFANLK